MFLYSQWLSLPINVRVEMAQKFGIQKKNPTHVQDNVIVNDGYLIQEVENALTLENLQSYLETNETDMNILWDMIRNPQHYAFKGIVEPEPVTGLIDMDFGIQRLDNIEEVKKVENTEVKKKGGRPAGSKNK